MAESNPFLDIVAGYVTLFQAGRKLAPPAPGDVRRQITDSRRVMLFSPHPDDECLNGGLPLRLLRQSGLKVINVAVTLGSLKSRRATRRHELEQACAHLGFECLVPLSGGLERINLMTRRQDRPHWADAATALAEIIARHLPELVFLPHARDGHPTHRATHYLVRDALQLQAANFDCWLIETEYWAPLTAPNLLVESSPVEVADMMAGLACHCGEVARNPYHLRLPAWLIDNVRRGSELIQGSGAAAAEMMFGTLYRRGRWVNGKLAGCAEDNRLCFSSDDAMSLFHLPTSSVVDYGN